MNKPFASCHPITNILFFVIAMILPLLSFHPVLLSVCLFASFINTISNVKLASLKYSLIIMIPMAIFCIIVNPFFSSNGNTKLFTVLNNTVTLEAVLYGSCLFISIFSIVINFAFLNFIMTSDKWTYLFGRIFPSLALVFSIALKFIPSLKFKLKEINDAQKTIENNTSKKNKAKTFVNKLSALTSISLENSIKTSDSMVSRGFGTSRRTSFFTFSISKRDIFLLISMVTLIILIILNLLSGQINIVFYPKLYIPNTSINLILCSCFYFIFLLIPTFLNIWEEILFLCLKYKI